MTKATKPKPKAASARGGARAGAGRPPILGTKLTTITIRVDPRVAAFLKSGASVARVLAPIVEGSEEFQNFLRKNYPCQLRGGATISDNFGPESFE